MKREIFLLSAVGLTPYAYADTICTTTSLTSTTQMAVACAPENNADNITSPSDTTITVVGKSNGAEDIAAIGLVSSNNSGLITNNGTITGTGYTRGIEITNDLSATGIVNTGTIDVEGHGIELGYALASSTAKGNITGFSNSSLYNGNLAIYNSGKITANAAGGSSATAWGDESAIRVGQSSIVTGDIYNTGTGVITGYEYGINISHTASTLNGNIVNDGRIAGDSGGGIRNNGSLDGGIYNYGSISSTDSYGIKNNGIISGSIYNDTTGTIASMASDGINNTGTVAEVNNYGSISGTNSSIDTSEGAVTNGINNYGVLSGKILLGSNTLNLLTSSSSIVSNPEVEGDITGDDDSVINVGSASNNTTFTTDGDASVGNITVASGSTLDLSDGATWAASDTITNNGTVSLAADATSATLMGAVLNNGAFNVNNSCATCAGHTLYVDGDYTGNAGTLSLGTVLGGDDSLTDKLVISGAATGTTYVSVTNKGGTGAQTDKGIMVIESGSSTSDAFVQSGRIVSGVYEYHLQQGNSSGENTSNWYLTDTITETEPPATEPPATEPPATEPPATEPPATETPTPGSSTETTPKTTTVYRPEAGSYASNLMAANTLFNMTLHDRLGETQYTDALTGEKKVTSMWLRVVGGHNTYYMNAGQNRTQANRYIFQLGGDIAQWSTDGLDRYHLGVMGGYANQHSGTINNVTGYKSSGIIDGYSVGLYGTWYQNDKDKTGVYVDTWALYNWFDNEVKGDDLPSESYNSKGIVASVESGYTFHPGSYQTRGGMTNNVYIQPQVQVTWMGVEADDHRETNGTLVTGSGNNNIQTRLGVRLFLNGKSHLDKGTDREFEPFVEANWIHNTRSIGVSMNNNSNQISGDRNIGQLKVGVEGKLSNNLNLWGNVAQSMGGSGYADTQGVIGVKYMFK